MSTVVTILITILIFCLIILIHELGHFLVAKASGIKVNEFSMGMGPAIWKKQGKETLYAIRIFPIGGYVQMEGEDENSEDKRSFNNAHVLKRIAVVLAGAMMNFILGLVLMGIITACQPQVPLAEVGEVTSDQSVFQQGDKLLSVNGHGVVSAADFRFQIQRVAADEPLNVTVKRNGKKMELKDATFNTESDGQQVRSLGFMLQVENLNVGNFFSSTFGNTAFYAKLVWTSLADLVTGQVSLSSVSGPVGVGQAVGQAQSMGILSVLSLFALITINVGIFNLLPFPALDGGRFVFLLIELIFRKPVKREIEGYINAAGMALLLLLMVVITGKDIIQLFIH